MLTVRPYRSGDYDSLKRLYEQGDLYGGQFDPARDAPERIAAVIAVDPQSILVCEKADEIVGTVSLIDNGRIAWLFRFAVEKGNDEKNVARKLHMAACDILKLRGHSQVLVYTPAGNTSLDQRYFDLGMNKGGDYTCFWQGL